MEDEGKTENSVTNGMLRPTLCKNWPHFGLPFVAQSQNPNKGFLLRAQGGQHPNKYRTGS